MDINVHTDNRNIRKIEDIIDIQKANGNFSVRQVAFNLPADNESIVSRSSNVAKSLESGLSNNSKTSRKKQKLRSSRNKSPMPDVISWPSDSDITVLRMQISLDCNDLQDKNTDIPGDGLHQPDSSSMINLATLMRRSQPASKHSLNLEEYLLPLTSWEQEEKQPKAEDKISDEGKRLKHYITEQ
ncbi:hypothetical protein K1T71_002872 [Dendrolimus kikuchii]|uniref:Uncharacterized protein n=1 Tax=Dendrolimus kikuchii TaxID=765133 RepID=A0ACC1DEA2_9NEOP|nr:hypothetical protein K1T71_002872 [Dendrolimus kikuchii]